tara:strand:+ start:555 stop:1205 length:651 start_codon:yes stop_codon:yes gene_type:complete
MKTQFNQKGFTLIELLVVITIIAILASVSVPVFSSIQQKAKVNKSMQQVSGIYKGVYALYGEDGFLPSGDNANDILAEVAVEMDSEKPFYVAGCAWHGNGQTKTGGDNFHERSTPQGIALEPGANHYAVNKDSRFEPRYPMLASGFSSTVGQYAQAKADLGGIWEGKTAVIIYGTGDAEIVKLDLSGKAMKDMGGRNIDLFDYQGKVQMVNPQRGN